MNKRNRETDGKTGEKVSAVDSSALILKKLEQMLGQLKDLHAMKVDIETLKTDIAKTRAEIATLQEYQVDQERERHSLLLSAAAGRSGVQSRETPLTFSGAKFKTKTKDRVPSPLYF